MNAEGQYVHNICKILLPKHQYVRIDQEVSDNRFSLDKAAETSMNGLKNYGENQAMDSIAQIKRQFLTKKIEEVQFYNIKG